MRSWSSWETGSEEAGWPLVVAGGRGLLVAETRGRRWGLRGSEGCVLCGSGAIAALRAACCVGCVSLSACLGDGHQLCCRASVSVLSLTRSVLLDSSWLM